MRAIARCGDDEAVGPEWLVEGPGARARYCGFRETRAHRDRSQRTVAPDGARVVLQARCGTMLRLVAAPGVGATLIDACDGRVLLDLAAVGEPIADVDAPEDTTRLTRRELETLDGSECAGERAVLRLGHDGADGLAASLAAGLRADPAIVSVFPR